MIIDNNNKLDLIPLDDNADVQELDLQPVVDEQKYNSGDGLKKWSISAPDRKHPLFDKIGNAIKMAVQLPFYAYSQGHKNIRSAELNTKSIFGNLSNEEKAELDALEHSYRRNFGVPENKGLINYDESLLENPVNMLPERAKNSAINYIQTGVEQLPITVDTMREVGVWSVAGGALGGIAGGILGAFKGSPIESAKAGLKLGMRICGGAGASKRMFELETGFAKQELKNMKDKDGNALDENLVNSLSIGVGAINMGLESIGTIAELGLIPDADKWLPMAKKQVIQKAITDDTLRGKLTELGVKYAKAIATESGTEVAQEITNIFADEIAKSLHGNFDDQFITENGVNQQVLKDYIGRLAETAVTSILPSALIGGVGTGLTARKILVENGMDEKQAKDVVDKLSPDELTELINENEETLLNIAEKEMKQEQIQEKLNENYNKLVSIGLEEDNAFATTELLKSFINNRQISHEDKLKWLESINYTNKPLEGYVTMNEDERSNYLENPGSSIDETKIQENFENKFGISMSDMQENIKSDVINILQENEIGTENFNVEDVKIYGSQTDGKAKAGSDIDILVQYSGDMREDNAFNILNENQITIQDVNGNDINIDINPINSANETIDEHIERMSKLEPKSESYFQSAMYKAPQTNIKDFINAVNTKENNNKQFNKSYFSYLNKNVSVRIPHDTVNHTKKHALSAEEWENVLQNLTNIENATISKKEYSNDKVALMKINTPMGKYGVTIQFANGANNISTVFKSTDKGIDNWIKKGSANSITSEPLSSPELNSDTVAVVSQNPNDIITDIKNNLNPNGRTLFQMANSENLQNERGINALDNDNITDSKGKKSLEDIHDEIRSNKKTGLEYLGYFTKQQETNLIGVMENANASTVVHELGHCFLEGLNEFANSGDEKSIEIVNEIDRILGKTGTEYTVEQHEKFAQYFEAYLYNEHAPSNKMIEIFELFKDWLRGIRDYWLNNEKYKMPEDVKAVFDKIFSDEQLTEEQAKVKDLVSRAKNIRLSEKMTDMEKRHKNVAYSIVSRATGYPINYLKAILESSKNTKKISKARTEIARRCNECDDKISKETYPLEWLEFYGDENLYVDGHDYLLAEYALNDINNGNYKTEVNIYDYFNEHEAQYEFLLKQYKINKDEDSRKIAFSAMMEWLDELQNKDMEDCLIFSEKFPKDLEYIERFEKLDKFEQAKETILNSAKKISSEGLKKDEEYKQIVLATMNGLNFLTPSDKARLVANVMDCSNYLFLSSQIDSILDIAKTMQEVAYRRKLFNDIQNEIRSTKNIKQSNKTVGKYDYRTNKLFEQLREFNRMNTEEANEVRLSMAELDMAEDEGLTFEHRMINTFINIKADGMTYANTALLKQLYDDIIKIKLAGRDAKSAIELSKKLNNSKAVDELISVLESKNKAKEITKKYISLLANWESCLNTLFNKGIKDKYSLLSAETKTSVWIHKEKKNFEAEVAKIYNLNRLNFDKNIIQNLTTKIEVMENIREKQLDDEGKAIYPVLRTVPRTLNKMELILIYMWSKNEVLYKRLCNQFGEESLDAMDSELTEQDKALGDLMMKTINKYYEPANEVFIRKYGLDLPKVSAYFPSVVERESSEIDLLNDFTQKSMNPSFIKRRTEAEFLSMEFANPVAMLYSHIEGMGRFINMTDILDKENKVFKDKTIKRLIKNTYGEDSYKTMIQLLANSSYKQNQTVFNGISKIQNGLIQNWISGNVMWKMSVGIKQLFSACNYATSMPMTEWLNGFAKALSNPKATLDYMMKIPYLKTRFESGSQNEFLKQTIENSAFAFSKKLKDLLSLNIRTGDIGAIVFGGKPYIDYLVKSGMSEDKAIEQFILQTQRTQQSAQTSSLSNFQVSAGRDAWAKIFTAYQNSKAQYIRKVGDSIVDYCNGDADKKQVAKDVFMYMFLQPFLYKLGTTLSLITLLTTGNDDDLRNDLISSIFDFNATCLNIYGVLYDYVMNTLISGSPSKTQTTPLIGDLEKEIANVAKNGVDASDWLQFIGYGIQVGIGIPVNSMSNSALGIGDMAQGDILKGTLRTLGWSERRSELASGTRKNKRKSNSTLKFE